MNLFLAPYTILFSLPIVIGVLFLFRRNEKIRAELATYFGLTLPKTLLFTGLLLVFLATLSIALLRPSSGSEEIEINQELHDTLILFDISVSMNATDVAPSRLQYGKRLIEDLLQAAERTGTRKERFGIVLYAGESYLLCPLTGDYGAIRQYISVIAPDLITAGGSNITGALNVALQTLATIGARRTTLLLLTDGEDTLFNRESALKLLEGSNHSLITVGIGTREGAAIPDENGRFIRDARGELILSKLAHDTLRSLTEELNGHYFAYRPALDMATDVAAILFRATGGESDDLSLREKIVVYYEITHWLALFALLILGSMLLLPATRSRILSITILVLATSVTRPVSAEEQVTPPPPATRYEAAREYESGNIDAAVRGFESLHAANPDDQKLTSAYAHALYKAGKFAEAAALFRKLADAASTGRDAYRYNYDLGNALLSAKRTKEAIDRYEQALASKPGDAAATFNRDLARRIIEEEQKKQAPKKEEEKKDSEKKEADKEKQQSEDSDQKQDEQDSNSEQSEQNSQKESADENQDKQPSEPQDKDQAGEEQKDQQKQDSQTNQDQESSDTEDKSPSQSQEEKQQDEQKVASQPNSESAEEPQRESQDATAQETSEGKTVTPLSASESEQWLDSLPDAPALIQTRRNRQRQRGGQYW